MMAGALLLFSFMQPEYFKMDAGVNNLFILGKCLSATYLLLQWRMLRKHAKILLVSAAFVTLPVVSTIINRGDLANIVINSGTTFFGMLASIWLLERWSEGLKAIFWIYFLCVVVNLVVMLVLPDGLYVQEFESGDLVRKYLLGYPDAGALFYLPAAIFSAVIARDGNKAYQKWHLLAVGIGVTSSIMSDSSASIVCLIALAAMMPFKRFGILEKYKYMPLVFVALLVVMKIQTLFDGIFQELFHKDAALSGRDEIWRLTTEMIMDNPLIGYGFSLAPKITLDTHMVVFHCHNLYLNIMYEGGVFAAMLFMAILWISHNRGFDGKGDDVGRYIASALSIFLLVFALDSNQQPVGLFVVIALAYQYGFRKACDA